MLESIITSTSNNSEARSLVDIFFDFISALDEAISTYKVLEKIKEQDPKPHQLLFCHIINSFDSSIDALFESVICNDSGQLREYFSKCKNLEEKISLKQFLEMRDLGVDDWMKKEVKVIIEDDLRRKRHSQVLEMLMKLLKINNLYVWLSGGSGNQQSGRLKKNPTKPAKKTVNHNTTSENAIGYADILYEKRNAITHNRNRWSDKVIARLNTDWDLKMRFKYVVIKRDTIKSVVRFYTSLLLVLLESGLVKNTIEVSQYENLKNNLENLRLIQSLKTIKRGADGRSIAGGIGDRKAKLISSPHKLFTIESYSSENNISFSTARRDISVFLKERVVKKNGKSEYAIRK
jgi:hypothetical protein